MKILVVLFLIFFSFYLTAKAGPDTTFTADLNGDGKSDNVSIKVYKDAKIKYGSGIYTLKVNNASYSDTAYFEENALLKLVNLDKKDDFKELALIYWVDPEQNCDLFRYDGKSIIKIGSLSTMSDEFEFAGDGTIKISDWMGFWLAEAVCTYDESSKRFKEKYKDEYNLDITPYEGKTINVKEPFELLKKHEDNADVSAKVKTGANINILKAVITGKCVSNEEHPNSELYWYFIKTNTGDTGWIRLKDFQEKVKGIPWAG